MTTRSSILQHMYERFNARDIDGVLATLADDVQWANGMDGGYVHGLEAVRAYWTRQWAIVSPTLTPQSVDERADGTVLVKAQQTIRDLEGKPLQDADFGLQDKIVGHVFHFKGDKVARFDIEGDA